MDPHPRLAPTPVPVSTSAPHPARTGPRGCAGQSLHVDCDACAVRGPACHDCVVTALLGPPPELAFDEEERHALAVLAGSGLVPPLRMVRAVDGPDVETQLGQAGSA